MTSALNMIPSSPPVAVPTKHGERPQDFAKGTRNVLN